MVSHVPVNITVLQTVQQIKRDLSKTIKQGRHCCACCVSRCCGWFLLINILGVFLNEHIHKKERKIVCSLVCFFLIGSSHVWMDHFKVKLLPLYVVKKTEKKSIWKGILAFSTRVLWSMGARKLLQNEFGSYGDSTWQDYTMQWHRTSQSNNHSTGLFFCLLSKSKII